MQEKIIKELSKVLENNLAPWIQCHTICRPWPQQQSLKSAFYTTNLQHTFLGLKMIPTTPPQLNSAQDFSGHYERIKCYGNEGGGCFTNKKPLALNSIDVLLLYWRCGWGKGWQRTPTSAWRRWPLFHWLKLLQFLRFSGCFAGYEVALILWKVHWNFGLHGEGATNHPVKKRYNQLILDLDPECTTSIIKRLEVRGKMTECKKMFFDMHCC